MVSTLFGALDEFPSDLDRELGDHVIALYSQICALPAQQMTVSDFEAVIWKASLMLRLPGFEGRLRPLLGGSSFANNLYKCLVQLAKPKRAFDTAVRTALAFSTFSCVTVQQGLPGPERLHPEPASQAHSRTSKSPSLPLSVEKSKRLQAYEAAANSPSNLVPDIFQLALAFLAPEDCNVGHKRLMPVEKQQAFELLVSLRNRENPRPGTCAYYAFGYPSASNDDEAMALGGLYATLLQVEGQERQMFEELWVALRDNALVDYFDQRGWQCFRREIPCAEKFLNTPPSSRETVWRLIEFLRDEQATEPPRALKRDYGFHICKTREEVIFLKDMLKDLLASLGPKKLHEACIHGRLQEKAVRAKVTIKPQYRRLLRNHYPYPGLGYEKFKDEYEFAEPLFKRPLRR